MGYYVDGVFVPRDEYSGFSYFIEYWLNLSRDEYTAEQLINALTFAVFLHGTKAIPTGFSLGDWRGRISDNTALQLIMTTVDAYVNELPRSNRGFVELPFNTEKDIYGFREFHLIGLKYGQYGDMNNTFYWGEPDFVQKIMVAALYWNFKNEESRIAFNDLSNREGGKMTTHNSHRDGIDVDLKIQWWNSTNRTYDDLNNILPGKTGYNIYLKGNSFYQTFGKQKNQQFIDMIRSIYPDVFKEILWCDWTLRGVSPLIKTDAQLRYNHRHHIHLGF